VTSQRPPTEALKRELESVRFASGPEVPQPSIGHIIANRVFWMFLASAGVFVIFYLIWSLVLTP